MKNGDVVRVKILGIEFDGKEGLVTQLLGGYPLRIKVLIDGKENIFYEDDLIKLARKEL